MAERLPSDDVVPLAPPALSHAVPASLVRSEHARVVELWARQVVCREGDPSDTLHVVERGAVKVTRTTPRGAQVVLGILGPGEVLGEVSLMDGGARSASAEALTPVRLRSIPAEVVIAQYDDRVEVRAWLLSVLARRLRHAGTVSTELVFSGVAERVATVLLDLARRFGADHAGSVLVDHGLTQTELAQLVGTTRESANRVLSRFVRRGWISVGPTSFTVHDLPSLDLAVARPAGSLRTGWEA